MKPITLLFPTILLLASLPAQRVVATGDAALAVGPGFAATFAPDGMTFRPDAVGTDPKPFHWRLAAVRRGSVDVWVRRGDCAAEIVGETVRQAHQGGPIETYDVRDDGIEQSFVFATRPAGSGDLVVAGVIRTELPLLEVGADGARFGTAAAAISFGAVTGVDANGATVRGGMRVVGDTIELSLPATFVDSATYPLVLDPLIGSSFLVANASTGSDVLPSVAYDMTTQRYLVVWSVGTSATTAEIRGQFVSATGAVGQQFLFTTSAFPDVRPGVANINEQDRFLVTYNLGAWGQVVAVDAATGAVSAAATWSAATPPITAMAIGGDPYIRPSLEAGLWVVRTGSPQAASTISWRQVFANGATPTLGPVHSVNTTGYDVGAPAVTKISSSTERWTFTFGWRLQGNPTAFGVFLGRADNQNGGAACSSTNVNWTSTAGATPLHTSVATNGGTSLIAYQESPSTIAVRTVSGAPCQSTPTVGPVFYPTTSIGADDSPEVECALYKWMFAWRNQGSALHTRVLGTLPGAPLQSGGWEYAEGPTPANQYHPTVCTRYSGGDYASDEGLVVWANAGIRARRWKAVGTGTVTNLGGACGVTGFNDFASYSGTPVIGSTFAMQLLSPTSPVVALVVGFTATPLACGPCTLVPSPDLMLGALASANVTLPFDPVLIGLDLIAQWVQWRPGGCPLYPTLGVSNALKFTIAE